MTETDSHAPLGDVATAEDIATLNRMAVERSATFTRIAGTVALVAGVAGIVAWLWIVVRMQLAMDDGGGFSVVPQVDDEITVVDRVDAVAAYAESLVVAVLVAAVGLALRGVADYTVARTGGSLTGFRVGDDLPLPDAEVELELLDPPGP